MTENRHDDELNPERQSRFRSLTVRVAGLLTLALFPIGLIAIVQSVEAIRTTQENFRDSLSGQTYAAALPEGTVISEVVRRAEGMALAMPDVVDDPAECAALIERASARMSNLSFIGFTTPDFMSDCNTTGERLDFRENENARSVVNSRESGIDFVQQGQVSNQAIVSIWEPIFDDQGAYLGMLALSYPSRSLDDIRAEARVDDDVMLVTFSSEGEILTSRRPPEEILERLPEGQSLRDLSQASGLTFTAQDSLGVQRDYAVLPIAPDRAYALGIRKTPLLFGAGGSVLIGTLLLPLVMWAISLIVAVLALQRLVIAPIQTLRMRMLNFADGRSIFRANSLSRAPRELREIGATFEGIAEGVVRDEALLEDRLHERGLLLREVHHRVKNNLQIMSSIINMQIRRSKSPEAIETLTTVQGRLASLAKFHQDLYSTSSLSKLRADEVLEALVKQMFGAMVQDPNGMQLHLDLEEIVLPPDQVGPLAMLVTEALTNSIKYAGTTSDVPTHISLTMRMTNEDDKDICRVRLENSVPLGSTFDPHSSGLGTRLIKGFALQLDADLTQEVEEERFVLEVAFERRWPKTDSDGTESESQAFKGLSA